jgi:hypothetical protein
MHRTARGRSGPCMHDEAHSLCVWEGKKTVPDRVASSSWLPVPYPPAAHSNTPIIRSTAGRIDGPGRRSQRKQEIRSVLSYSHIRLNWWTSETGSTEMHRWIQDHFPAARAHRHGFVAADGRAGVWSTGRSPGFSNDSCLGTICCNNLSVHPASCCFSIRSPAALLVPAHSLSVRTDIPLFGPHPALQLKLNKASI